MIVLFSAIVSDTRVLEVGILANKMKVDNGMEAMEVAGGEVLIAEQR